MKYPDTGGGILTRLEKQSNVTPHLPDNNLPLVPQQLDPRHRHLRCRFAAKRVNDHSFQIQLAKIKIKDYNEKK